jgi:GNAT superfamily N-acetyltransferase
VNEPPAAPGTKTSEAPTADPPSAGPAPLRLSAFNWSGFVADQFSASLLTGSVAAGVGLFLVDPGRLPNWLVYSPWLIFPMLIFAFIRVWKTIREEHETSALWDGLAAGVSPSGSGMADVKDAVFEIPYLFSILVLPFSAVFFQGFALCLLLFYVCDNYYNLALVRAIGTEHCVRLPWLLQKVTTLGHRLRHGAGDLLHGLTFGRVAASAEPVFALLGAALATGCSVVDPAPNSIDRVVLMRYFGRRARLDTFAIWLLLGAFAAVTVLIASGRRDFALGASLVAVAALLVMELVVEPFRALGVQSQAAQEGTADTGGELLLWTVPRGANLDDSVSALREIHERAFLPPERQYDVDDMLTRTGRRGFSLLVLTEREERTMAHVVAGYLFLEARPRRDVAFLWYVAISEHRRGHGLGHTLVSLALDEVHDRWPSVRAVFLETSRPASGEREDAPSEEMRRVRFYRDIGFWWVRGLEYEIPAEGDPQKSLRYDPMFHALREAPQDIGHRFVREAVLEMARDNFSTRRRWPVTGKQPDDPRWKKLVASTDEVFRMGP